MEYIIDQLDSGEWQVRWGFATNGDLIYCQRIYKRKHNAMIFLARLKDGHFSTQQQFRWCYKRESKKSAGS